MPITATQILTAIESDELDAKVIPDGEEFAIAIRIAEIEIARVGCLRIERPFAKLTHDGQSVDVYPSPGMPDGFTIACDNHEEAIVIEEALEDCFETAYLDLVAPER